ncbi:TonB-dependent receptor [Peristeroidobacter soli]|uniref:TonB-dependent receptor n=1 Tax=Peristeroidobacter soli TaxID=2497877 RepID=UPI00101CCE0D|nr:TonB-dependent receptor [Peristeroidobacter soli]
MPSIKKVRATLLAVACAMALPAVADSTKAVDIPAGDLRQALLKLSEVYGAELVYRPEQVQGIATSGARGELTTQQAIKLLLQGTPLELHTDKSGAMLIAPAVSEARPEAISLDTSNDRQRSNRVRLARADAQEPAGDASATELKEIDLHIPEVMVTGSRLLNADIRRSADDPQPYVVFDREAIERSGAKDLTDFLKQRLPQNTQAHTQGLGVTGNASEVNLRGLGNGQTLILIDGRRMASTATSYVGLPPNQPDLNGIPLSSIERIEVLPTTASGIYGGSATGGVINIITRRDYEGLETTIAYGDAFDGDASTRRIDMTGGFSLEDGRTSVVLTGSYSEVNGLEVRDRQHLRERGVREILANNPAHYYADYRPPLGATPNIRSVDGSVLTLRNGTSLGSSFTNVPANYAGVASDGGAGLVANAGTYNLAMGNFAGSGNARESISSSPTVKSLRATVRRSFTDSIEAFVEANVAENRGVTNSNQSTTTYVVPASSSINPFNQDVQVRFNNGAADGEMHTQLDTQRMAGGLIVRLPHRWMANADYAWSSSKLQFARPAGFGPALATALTNGTFDIFRDNLTSADFASVLPGASLVTSTIKPFETTQNSLSLRVGGPVLELPAGSVTITGLIERRDEDFATASFSENGLRYIYPSRSQTIDSAYLEAWVPVISAKNALPGIESLDLQLSGRWDRYELNGSTNTVSSPDAPVSRVSSAVESTNPTLGLRYSPIQDITLRASFGTGFMPPAVTQLTPGAPFSYSGYIDPRRANEHTAEVSTIAGGSPTLQPEDSRSWSAGLILKPRFIDNLRLSVDYTRITKTDGIVTLTTQQVIDNEAYLPGRVTRATPVPGDPFGVGQIAQVDATSVNLATAKIEAYDVALNYQWNTGSFGSFEFFTQATWQTHYQTRVTPTAPLVENVGVAYINPLKLKANAGLTWTRDAWTVGWVARYFDSYFVYNYPLYILDQGGDAMVEDQIYNDLYGTYRVPANGDGWVSRALAGAEINLGLTNIFNENPSFDAVNTWGSLFGDARGRCFQLSLRMSF